MCKSSVLCNNHRSGHVLKLSLYPVSSIDLYCSLIYEHLQTLLHGVTSHRPCFSPQHVLYFPAILNFVLLQLNLNAVQFCLKTGELAFQTLCSCFSFSPSHGWRMTPDIPCVWRVSSLLLKCQQLRSRVTTMERGPTACLVAELKFFRKIMPFVHKQ